MHRKRLVATVAAAPLLLFAQGAWAETTITTAVTAPVQTSATNDDVRVTSTGSIKPTVAGAALLMNSDDSITNEGVITTPDLDGVSGMQAAGGLTGNITNKGTISVLEDYTATDTDPDGTGPLTGDGDLDGPFAEGSDRYGVRVTGGTGPLAGSVLNDTTGTITVEGNNSAAISIESGLAAAGAATGSVTNNGTLNVVGDNSFGIRTTGDITGSVMVNGTTSVKGAGSVGAAVDSNVAGGVRVQGAVTATGYRYTTRPATADARAKLDADDLLTGGPAVRVSGDVANGVMVDIRPTDASTTDADEDDDGIEDAKEGNGALASFGTAAALQVGSGDNAVTIGAVGTGDNAYGVISKGAISADGVFDGKAATAIQIGAAPTDDEDPAFATTVAGGVRNDGAVTSRAFQANSTGIVLKDAATLSGAGVILNTGQITAQTLINSAPAGTEGAFAATGVLLEAGSQATVLRNGGVIGAAVSGENGSAYGVRDLSGTLTTVENTGRIQAQVIPTDDADDTDDTDIDPTNETITGAHVAIDVSAATHAVTITQSGVDDGDDGDDNVADLDTDDDGVDDADEPLIFGDVRMGSGADTLNLNNGSMIGDAEFGAGADTFNINGGATFSGHIADSDDQLTINLNDGRLAVSDTSTITATALNVGAEGTLLVTIDPEADTSTRFDVDTASFATGSKVGVQVTGLLTFTNLNDTKDYLIVDAGTLTAGTIDASLLGTSPFIYNVGVNADEATDQVLLTVRRRTAAEAGLNASQSAAFDAFYLALAEDEEIRDEFLERFSRDDFLQIYNQMLPDQGEGLFSTLDYASLSISRGAAVRPDLRQRYGPDSFWVQELNVQVKRDGGETLGSEAKGFGFVGGYESMDDKGGALGATLAYVNAEENDDAAAVGEQTTVSLFEAGAYWRRAAGSWLFSVRGGAGYAFFDGTRRFVTPATSVTDLAVVREATAEWNGVTASASASVAYEARFGRYYARPTLAVDYFYLSEGERQETGWDALNQTVDERTSSRLSGTAELAFGAEFGRDFWWRPEVKVGFRQVLAGEVGDTVARFGSGDPFTLQAMEAGDGAAIVGLALRAGTAMSYLALEAEMERVKNEQRYNAKLSGRVMF